jgi:hypothetical protein
MDVLEPHDERPGPRGGFEERADGPEELVRDRGPLGQPEHGRDLLGHEIGIRTGPDGRGDLATGGLRRIVVRDARDRLHDL